MSDYVSITTADDKTQKIYAKQVTRDSQGTTVTDTSGDTKFFPHATTKQVDVPRSLT